jgi:hypothetical protein
MSQDSQLPYVIQAAGEMLDVAWNAFLEKFDDMMNNLVGKLGELLGGIGGKIGELGGAMKQSIGNAMSPSPPTPKVEKTISEPAIEKSPAKEVSAPSMQVQQAISGLDFGGISQFAEVDESIRGCASPALYVSHRAPSVGMQLARA